MKIKEIQQFPTVLAGEKLHESLTRSYQTLEKVKEMLRLNTPAEVILEIVEECQNAPGVEADYRGESEQCNPVFRKIGTVENARFAPFAPYEYGGPPLSQ